jgi:hypothetical protein
MSTPIKHFPRGRALWAVAIATEEALGRFPMVLMTPIVGAFAGTAWAVSHPSRQIVRNRVVVGGVSFTEALWLAIIGSVGGLFIAGGLLLWGMLLYVRVWLPLWDRHRGWEPTWEYFPGSDAVFLRLKCRIFPPISTDSLGHKECVVRHEGTIKVLASGDSVLETSIPTGDVNLSIPTVQAILSLHGESGEYEVRWYGTNRKRYEIARKTFVIQSPAAALRSSQDESKQRQP